MKKCKSCGKEKPESEFYPWKGRKLTPWCKPCWKAYNTKRHNVAKIAVFWFYSNGAPHCACCGEKEMKFLTLDHIHGNPNKEVGGKVFCYTLVKRGFPPGYQILCFNCNNAKHIYKVCPHKEINKQ